LESALSRPVTAIGNTLKYPTIEMAGAALLHSLVHNHPFHNGNKRTAIVAFLVFLDLNQYVLTASEDELFTYVLALAAHENLDVNEEMVVSDNETISAARWIVNKSRKLSKVERRMSWRDLRSLLSEYVCTFENREGNKVTIHRGALIAHVGRRNDGDEIDKGTIAYVREALELNEEHGIDSEIFYYRASVIHEFINRYRKILTRLAAY